MSAVMPKSAPKERSPIVVVMGHVDHGKTTLLDTIRKTKAKKEEKRIKTVADKESGGITQHIGAYEVLCGEKRVTFIDTPGHEAFSAMRLRGAKVADVALLIVAADDGVKPQTKEALKFIQSAKLPFIVVLNKIDRPSADSEKVKNELATENVLVEGRGGQVPVVEVSAKDGKGIENLIETILLVAEMEEFKYDAVKQAGGYVLEAHRDPKRGITTDIVLTDGTLRTGDMLVCGASSGKIKIMEDYRGERIKGAIPSSPLKIVGLSEIAVAGDPCKVVFSDAEAKKEVAEHQDILKEHLESLVLEPEGQEKVLQILVKADFQGSLDALVNSLRQIKSEKVGLKIVKCGVGDVSDGDIKFAEATKAIVVAFRSKITKEAKNYSEQKKINIESYDVIYELIEGVREKMSHLLEAEVIKKELGRLKVLAIFRTESARMIIGGKITEGKFKQGVKVEVERADEIIGSGKIVQLKVGETKQDEVGKGNEAGILYDGPVKIKEDDIIIAFEEEKIYPTLE